MQRLYHEKPIFGDKINKIKYKLEPIIRIIYLPIYSIIFKNMLLLKSSRPEGGGCFFCERDSSGTTVATEWRSHEGAKVMERIARRERRNAAKRLAQKTSLRSV
jgi:hypothetical protein